MHTDALLTSVLLQGEWSASRLGRLTPKVKHDGAHRTGGCADSSHWLKAKKLHSSRQQDRVGPACSLNTIVTEL